MGDLNRRLKEASAEVERDQAPLRPRAAARQERIAKGVASKQARVAAHSAFRGEVARRYELGHIVNTLRDVLHDANDSGTRGFGRDRQFRKRLRLGRRPRGWIVGRLAVPIALATHVVESECQLILAVDGRVYAALDGVIGDRYQIGQDNPPRTAWLLAPQVWRAVEASIPETVGLLVGRLDLPWPLD